MRVMCPNCAQPVIGHERNGCVLYAFIELLNDRDTKTRRQLESIHRNCNVDAMWNDIGPILDRLETGGYST
jgi:hypothetical protein